MIKPASAQQRPRQAKSLIAIARGAGLASLAIGIVALADIVPALAQSEVAAVDTGTIVVGNEAPLSRSVNLGLNKSVVVDLPRDARDVLVSDPRVADAVIRTSRRIYLTGTSVGQTNLIVFDRAGQQIVSLELNVERDGRALTAMLERMIPGSTIDVELVSDNIVLSGSVKNAADSRRAEDIASIFANGGVKAKSGNRVPGGENKPGAVVGQTDLASDVVNLLSIEGEDQVFLKVTIAEVNRNTVKQLGIDWDIDFSIGKLFGSALTSLPFSINPTPPGSKASLGLDGVFGTDIEGTIKALEQAGVFRTLAEPTLTAISGEQASFLAGGEFPVPVGSDANGIKIKFKPFGVALSFTPVVLSEGRISLRVKTEVSELSAEGALAIPGTNLTVPALNVRRAETTLELPSGGAMVMGGLLKDDVRNAIAGLPLLKDLPVLGTLFRSRDFQRDETELVIIAAPYLVKPVGRPEIARPDDGFSTPNDFDATILGRLNNVYGGPDQAPVGSFQGDIGFIYK